MLVVTHHLGVDFWKGCPFCSCSTVMQRNAIIVFKIVYIAPSSRQEFFTVNRHGHSSQTKARKPFSTIHLFRIPSQHNHYKLRLKNTADVMIGS